ncbi:limb development membrane protein 1 like [Rhinolophus ferrumequinum]|uniref:Limb development membrane protein 1 like n=1 Tax=Rhinolophus ferrumequinum TaxID=59479 RepID=A0A7J7WQH9_RHIFE|nr:limb development membrane protein 1 like [Rhinolophus ferrumequinum]
MEAADYEVLSVREQLFHERVRECIISTLLFATLYILCHIALTHFKKPAEFTTGSSSAPLPWRLPWVLSCSCPSPSSAMRCYSHCLGTTTSSGSTAPSSMVRGSRASGTSFFSSPTCPLSSSCPLHTSSLSLRALLAPERVSWAGSTRRW